MWARGLSALSAVAATLVLGGCTASISPGPATTGPSAEPVPRLEATLLQYRSDEGTNRLEVELTDVGPRPVTVSSVQLSWVGIRGAPRAAANASYAPGQTIDLTTTYGVAACPVPARHAEPRAVVTLADGRSVDVRLDRNAAAMLRRVRARDCGLLALRRAASVTLGARFRTVRTVGAGQLSGRLVLRRPGDGATSGRHSVTLTQLTGSVLLTFAIAPTQTRPATLGPGQRRLAVPVLIGSTYRCDDHSVSQSTQTFLFSAYVRLDGAPPQRVILTPDRRLRTQSQALMRRACR